jgi:probable rRNA maturation factor
VAVQFAVPRRGLPGAAALRKWAKAAGAGSRGVTLRIVGSREARLLNRSFRRRDYATNVLSFPYGEAQGDVVLCHPVIAREARAQDKTLRAHYAHLVVHGLLHLRGYDHNRKQESARMERAEIRVLRRLGFGDPYELK